MRSDLPAGTVTFLMTDVESSTKVLHALGAEAYADALAEHRQAVREACAGVHCAPRPPVVLAPPHEPARPVGGADEP